MNKQELRKLIGYPEDKRLFDLQKMLSKLAAEWRLAYLDSNEEKQEQVQLAYYQTLLELFNSGWDANLDADSELPLLLMPKEYFERNTEALGETGRTIGDFQGIKSLISSIQKPASSVPSKRKILSSSVSRPNVPPQGIKAGAAWTLNEPNTKGHVVKRDTELVIRGQKSADTPSKSEAKPSKQQKPQDG